MTTNEVSSNGDITNYAVDYTTGEVYEVRSVDITYLQPIDISAIGSKIRFDEIVRERISRRRYRLWVSPMLLDMVVEKQISIPSLSVLCLLGQKIGYNNMVYTTFKDICIGSGYVRQTVSGAIAELKEKGLLRECSHKLEERDSRFFLVNPLYFFLGYYPHRDNLIKDWIMG